MSIAIVCWQQTSLCAGMYPAGCTESPTWMGDGVFTVPASALGSRGRYSQIALGCTGLFEGLDALAAVLDD